MPSKHAHPSSITPLSACLPVYLSASLLTSHNTRGEVAHEGAQTEKGHGAQEGLVRGEGVKRKEGGGERRVEIIHGGRGGAWHGFTMAPSLIPHHSTSTSRHTEPPYRHASCLSCLYWATTSPSLPSLPSLPFPPFPCAPPPPLTATATEMTVAISVRTYWA